MFEDIYPSPQKPSKRMTDPRFKFNLDQKMPRKAKSLSEQVKDLTDLRQLIQILEIAKVKVKRQKQKDRRARKLQRKKKWEN